MRQRLVILSSVLLGATLGAAAVAAPPRPVDPQHGSWLAPTGGSTARQADQNVERAQARQVDLVLALDVSGSMSGLIDSARQRLWDVVNELGQATPTPRLRVAVLSFGNPQYGAGNGYVRVDQPLTTDLDAVNRTLFAFQTNGGDEYVARAIHTAVEKLDWSGEPDALRILFVAGNESAAQDPMISLSRAVASANQRQVVVNTLFCGSGNDALVADWQSVAQMSNGMFASIDQNLAAVAAPSTPMDAPLARLNEALNKTYVGYGAGAQAAIRNQREQDANARSLSLPAAASRAETKASGLYSNSRWDLVDAVEAGKALDSIETEALPEPMRAMDDAAREAFVRDKAADRARIKSEIKTLAEQRRQFLQANREASADVGLDEAMKRGLRRIAERQGLELRR
ncbi:MAG: VWA domain-containing protein [Gammaproteobacteria bacterium]|nr:VWA domain-containing protein [Gammaproteobacteria bacterium]